MANKEVGKVPKQFLTVEQLAAYVGRHPARIRKYFAEGLLPEPANRIVHEQRIIRRFTLQEAEKMRLFFENMQYGTLAERRKNSVKRKKRR